MLNDVCGTPINSRMLSCIVNLAPSEWTMPIVVNCIRMLDGTCSALLVRLVLTLSLLFSSIRTCYHNMPPIFFLLCFFIYFDHVTQQDTSCPFLISDHS
jgi:hypothetical protein